MNVDFDLSKLLNISAKFHENRICSFLEITTNVMNKRTNQPTNQRINQQTRPITIAPDRAEVTDGSKICHSMIFSTSAVWGSVIS